MVITKIEFLDGKFLKTKTFSNEICFLTQGFGGKLYCACDVIVICIIQREFICNNRTIAVQNQNIWILWSQYSRYLIISGAYQYYYYCVLSCLNMIVRLWGWSWSSKGHLCSTIIDIVCHPALSWHYKQRFKFIEFTINYPCLAQIILLHV